MSTRPCRVVMSFVSLSYPFIISWFKWHTSSWPTNSGYCACNGSTMLACRRTVHQGCCWILLEHERSWKTFRNNNHHCSSLLLNVFLLDGWSRLKRSTRTYPMATSTRWLVSRLWRRWAAPKSSELQKYVWWTLMFSEPFVVVQPSAWRWNAFEKIPTNAKHRREMCKTVGIYVGRPGLMKSTSDKGTFNIPKASGSTRAAVLFASIPLQWRCRLILWNSITPLICSTVSVDHLAAHDGYILPPLTKVAVLHAYGQAGGVASA